MPEPESGNSTKGWLDRLAGVLSNEPESRADLTELLDKLYQHNLIDSQTHSMIEGVLHVSDLQVRDIMVPRGQMSVLSYQATQADILDAIIESGHSRLPVIDDDRDDIVGILLAKDFLALQKDSGDSIDLDDIIRPASFVPESKRLNVLLKDFRDSRNHLAMVVDEYGGIAGLVTIEDVLEQIVGDIGDEHDDEEVELIRQHGENRYSVRALTPLEDFNEYFGTAFEQEDVDTIGGLILSQLQHLPSRGEELDLEDLHFKVLSADRRQVHLYQITLDRPLNDVESSPL